MTSDKGAVGSMLACLGCRERGRGGGILKMQAKECAGKDPPNPVAVLSNVF